MFRFIVAGYIIHQSMVFATLQFSKTAAICFYKKFSCFLKNSFGDEATTA